MTSHPKSVSDGAPSLPSYATMPPGVKMNPSKWHSLPLGVNSNGEYATLDLNQGSNTLVVGPCGSGKTVFLRQYATAALTHGHDLIVIEPIRSGQDFASFKPWCAAFVVDGIGAARSMLGDVYAEGVRRRSLMFEHGVTSWSGLPTEVRPKPLTVLFDEFLPSLYPQHIPSDLSANDPFVMERNQANNDRVITVATVGKILREMRHTGIFLVLATQRFATSELPGLEEIRANLTHKVQLVRAGNSPRGEVLRLTFSADQTEKVIETLADLNDTSNGLAVMAADQDVTGFRVLFEQQSNIPALLEHRGVPHATPWVLS